MIGKVDFKGFDANIFRSAEHDERVLSIEDGFATVSEVLIENGSATRDRRVYFLWPYIMLPGLGTNNTSTLKHFVPLHHHISIAVKLGSNVK